METEKTIYLVTEYASGGEIFGEYITKYLTSQALASLYVVRHYIAGSIGK